MSLDKLLNLVYRIEWYIEQGTFEGETHGITPNYHYHFIENTKELDRRSHILNSIKYTLFPLYRNIGIEAVHGKPDFIFYTNPKIGALLGEEEQVMGCYLNYRVEKRDEAYFNETILIIPVIPDKPDVEIPCVLEFGFRK